MSLPEGVHLIRLECGKANAIDPAFLETLQRELEEALRIGARAVVLTGYDRYFSAGLNLTALPPSREGMLDFAERFDRALLRLLQFPLPVVAAVNGHAVAGGCVIACACDVRLGAEGDFWIGLSEVDIGVVFPAAALEVVRRAVSPAWITDVVLGARRMRPAEAQRAGILHDLAAPDKLLAKASETAEKLGAKPQPAYELTKLALAVETVRRIEDRAEAARTAFVDCWFSEPVKKRREALLQR